MPLSVFPQDGADQVYWGEFAVGEADKGLDLDGRITKIGQLFPAGVQDLDSTLSQEQITLLTSLERAEVLTGRVQA